MTIGAIVIVIIMVAFVGTARSADLVLTPPKRVIPGYSKQQATLRKQQTALEKQQAAKKQRAALERRSTQRKQADLEKQQAELQKQQAELQKQQAELQKQQADFEIQQAELHKQQTEIEKQQAELEKQQAELQKQQADFEIQQAELHKQQTEIEKEEDTFGFLMPTAATSITCDAARQIILGFGFENGRVPSGLTIATALDIYLGCHRWDRAGPIAPSGERSVNAER
jgi:hypothetical protein